jgi:hypothetical protein
VLATHEVLAQLALDGAGLTALAEEISRRVANPVLVEDRFLQIITRADPPLLEQAAPVAATGELARGDAHRDLVGYLATQRQPIRVAPGGHHAANHARIIAPIVIGGATVGYLSIVGRDQPIGNYSWLVLREAALAVAIEFVRQGIELDAQLRSATDFLDAILAGADTAPEIQGVRTSWLAFDARAPVRLLMLALDAHPATTSPPIDPPTARDVVKALLPWSRQRFHGSLIGLKDDRVVLVAATASDVADRAPNADTMAARPTRPATRRSAERALDPVSAGLVAEVRTQLRLSFPETSLSIAVAPPVEDWRDLRRTYGMTQRALTALELLGEGGKTISTNDPRLAIFLLLDGARPDALREFVDLVLGPLLAYDTPRGRSLVATLETYLEHGGQVETTARALKIHASTLKYRLQRISAIGGLDLRNADHRFNAALALRVRAMTP